MLDEKPQRLGELHFRLRYCASKQALFVTINKCCGLPPAKDPAAGSSDPYVKLQLLPDKQHKVSCYNSVIRLPLVYGSAPVCRAKIIESSLSFVLIGIFLCFICSIGPLKCVYSFIIKLKPCICA